MAANGSVWACPMKVAVEICSSLTYCLASSDWSYFFFFLAVAGQIADVESMCKNSVCGKEAVHISTHQMWVY